MGLWTTEGEVTATVGCRQIYNSMAGSHRLAPRDTSWSDAVHRVGDCAAAAGDSGGYERSLQRLDEWTVVPDVNHGTFACLHARQAEQLTLLCVRSCEFREKKKEVVIFAVFPLAAERPFQKIFANHKDQRLIDLRVGGTFKTCSQRLPH